MANYSSRLDNLFSALADPTRRAIIARLSQGDASVGELAQPFDMALPSLMKHIRVLETGGLVESGFDAWISARLAKARPTVLEPFPDGAIFRASRTLPTPHPASP